MKSSKFDLAVNFSKSNSLLKSLKSNSLSPLFISNPGSYKILERAYMKYGKGEIDRYFIDSLAGKALEQRLNAVVEYGKKSMYLLNSNLNNNRKLKIVNYGCGVARDSIRMALALKNIPAEFECIDVDKEALAKARRIVHKKKLLNFNFIDKSFLSMNYKQEIDLGLMIGVLCGLKKRPCISILKKIKKHIRKDGILIASNVVTTMRKKDFPMTYILCHLFKWRLVFKTEEDLKEIFERAGYKWIGCFYDEPSKFHCMGVGVPIG